MKFQKKLAIVSTAIAALAATVNANAAVDLTPITGAFTASDVTSGVMSVAAVLAVIYVSIKAAKIVLGMLRGG